MVIKLTEEKLLEILRVAWWEGHTESRYHPNPNSKAKLVAKQIIEEVDSNE